MDPVQQLRDLRNEINETYRSSARSDALRDSVIRAAKEMPPIVSPRTAAPHSVGSKTLVLCIADCHYGAEWVIRGLHGEV